MQMQYCERVVCWVRPNPWHLSQTAKRRKALMLLSNQRARTSMDCEYVHALNCEMNPVDRVK